MLHKATLVDSAVTPDWPARMAQLAVGARDPRLQAYYAAGAPAGDTPLSAVPMVALDIETTGLDPRQHEIVSVALVPMRLERIRSSATRHWIVRPRGGLVPESVAFHGITDAQIAAAPDFDAVLQPLLEAMSGQVVVVHCREIERGFLAAALQARIGEGIAFPVIDTMALEARLHRARRPGLLARWRKADAPVSIRLADSRSRYGLPPYRPHHAPTDALACAELLLAQVADRYSPSTLLAEVWQ